MPVIHGLHHVAIGVPDLGSAVDFYVEAFHCEVLFRAAIEGDRPDADAVVGIQHLTAQVAMLRFGGTHHLELWEYLRPEAIDCRSPANGLGFPHIAVRVSDIFAEHVRLAGLGMRFVGPPVTLRSSRAVYGTDPFGNLIELYEPTAEPG